MRRSIKAQEVTLHWLCAGGTGGVRVMNRAGIVLGSDCRETAAEATMAYNGSVPPSGSRDLAWKLQADAGTAWLLAVAVKT